MSALTITVEQEVARVTLARPNVRNAFDAALIGELHDTFERLSKDPLVRVVVLAGEGSVFCGGADIHWMRGALDLSYDENLVDAERMSDMFRAIDRCPKPVIGRVQGAALGGGSGLAAVCDVVIASEETLFGFTEVKLGIIPAVISPFVLAKIGVSHARALFVTGERFLAPRAKEMGLVHEVVAAEDLDSAVQRVVKEVLTAGPLAVAAAKHVIVEVRAASYDASRAITTRAIAAQRITPEGQEGLYAFVERRKASFSL